MAIPSIPNSQNVLRLLDWVFAATISILLLFQCVNNSDLFFHIALGRAILTSGYPPNLEMLYYTPISGNWQGEIRHTFVGDVFFAGVNDLVGLEAIQLIGVGITVAGFLILYFCSNRKMRTLGLQELLVVFCFYVVGTLQLQIPRNAMFGLLFLPAILALSDKVFEQRKPMWLVVMGLLFGVWSVCHGSYLLGIVLVVFLACMWAIDWLKNRDTLSGFHVISGIVALCLLIAMLGFANPAMKTYFTMPIDRATELISLVAQGIRSPHQPNDSPGFTVPSDSSGAIQEKIVDAMLSPLWKFSGETPISPEFRSAFRAHDYLPVKAMWVVAGLLIATALLTRSAPRIGECLILIFALYLGVCYVRFVGYFFIIATWIWFKWRGRFNWRMELEPRLMILTQAMVTLLLGAFAIHLAHAQWNGQLSSTIGERARDFGLGAVPEFDSRVTDSAKRLDPNGRTFTTIRSGSYAVYLWDGTRPVFIDAFFTAHPYELQRDYHQALTRFRSIDPLREKYLFSSALVENSNFGWNSIFYRNPNWIPTAVGVGMTLYQLHEPTMPPQKLEVLFSAQELGAMANAPDRFNAAAQLLNAVKMHSHRSTESPENPWSRENEALVHLARQYVAEAQSQAKNELQQFDAHGSYFIPLR